MRTTKAERQAEIAAALRRVDFLDAAFRDSMSKSVEGSAGYEALDEARVIASKQRRLLENLCDRNFCGAEISTSDWSATMDGGSALEDIGRKLVGELEPADDEFELAAGRAGQRKFAEELIGEAEATIGELKRNNERVQKTSNADHAGYRAAADSLETMTRLLHRRAVSYASMLDAGLPSDLDQAAELKRTKALYDHQLDEWVNALNSLAKK